MSMHSFRFAPALPCRVVLPCAAALALIVGGSSSASAAAPTFEHFSGSFTEVDTETCGFPITVEANFAVRVQFFYDGAGELDHSIAHVQLRATDSANGVTLIESANLTHTFDFTTGLNGDMGLSTQVRLPGGGVVAVDAGRVLSLDDGTVLFARGRHDFMSGDLARYCAAFGG